MRRRPLALALPLVALLIGSAPGASAATAEPVPSSMASLGDSITRAFNACGYYSDCPAESWSTGDDAAIGSHYSRILAKNPALSGRAFNDARTGAKAVDLDGQAATAVGQTPEYVTILMGANDACTSTEAGMTPVATFRSQVQAAMTRLTTALPTARIFVASIPDVKRLWYVGKDSASARYAWSSLKICQSLLASPTSTQKADVDRRARVQQRVVDFNTQLQQVCAQYAHCRYDGGATFGYPFVLSQVSGWDYFHPNKSGQTALASTTYAAGFGW